MSKIILLDSFYAWSPTYSLEEFLEEGNYPTGYIDFFEREDVQQTIMDISDEMKQQLEDRKRIDPPIYKVFRALYWATPENLRVVWIGQDPYPNGATGLSFDKPGCDTGSLGNIYDEMENEGIIPYRRDGDLKHWSHQGVLCINMALTVERGKSASHQADWSTFSERLLDYIDSKTKNIVWILLGSFAISMSFHISHGNKILCASHPSPFSAHKGVKNFPPFVGSNIFTRANKYLRKKGKGEICW